MDLVYSKGKYEIYKADDGHVLVNREMDGFAHSHVNNFKTCLWLIDLSTTKKIPCHTPRYLIISLIRVNDDKIYLRKLNELLNAKNKKHQMYYNSNKGVRHEKRHR